MLSNFLRAGFALALWFGANCAPTENSEISISDGQQIGTWKDWAIERRAPGDPTTPAGYGRTFWQSKKRTGVNNQPNLCLFYSSPQGSGSLSGTAQNFAHNIHKGLVTVWDQFPCPYYDPKEPERLAIYADDTQRALYFTYMSIAFAEFCSGEVRVMFNDPNQINEDGIWFKAEWPTLVGNALVTKITAIDTSGGKEKVIFDRAKGGVQGVTPPPQAPTIPTRRKVRATPDGIEVTDFTETSITQAFDLLLERADSPGSDCSEIDTNACLSPDCPPEANCFPDGIIQALLDGVHF